VNLEMVESMGFSIDHLVKFGNGYVYVYCSEF
jgi:hypothetical protein